MTPDAIKYQMTLESQERLRMRTWKPGDDDLDYDYDEAEYDDAPARPASWSDVAVTPTSRLIVWMLRRPNRRLGAVLAAVLVPAYLAVASALWQWTPPPDGTALLAVLGIAVALWNAAKFAVAGTACLLGELRSVERPRPQFLERPCYDFECRTAPGVEELARLHVPIRLPRNVASEPWQECRETDLDRTLVREVLGRNAHHSEAPGLDRSRVDADAISSLRPPFWEVGRRCPVIKVVCPLDAG